MINEKPLSPKSIRETIVTFVLENYISEYNANTLPLDQSLHELDVIDSVGIIELVEFMETTWSIVIEDSEIITEKMGSINKMTTFIFEKFPKQ